MNVPDLGAMAKAAPREVPLSEVPEEVRVGLEMEQGMRCYGCRGRITVGFEFVRFVATANVLRAEQSFACSREECDYAPRAAADSHAMRPVEWAWFDEQQEVPDGEPA